MALDREAVLQLAADAKEFSRGEKLFLEQRVKIQKVDSFWRGEKVFKASIDEGGEYQTSLSLQKDMLKRMICSCGKVNSVKICRHLVAAAFAVADYEKQMSAPYVSTSEEIRSMLSEYGNYRFAGMMAERITEKVKVIPTLHRRAGSLRLSLAFAENYSGKVRDLEEFVQAVGNGLPLKIGKLTIPVLCDEVFADEDQNLIRTVCDLVTEELQRSDKRLLSPGAKLIKEGQLLLVGTGLDSVLDCLAGRRIAWEEEGYPSGELAVTDRNPRLPLVIEPAGRGGIVLRVRVSFWAVQGNRSLYVCADKTIYRTDVSFKKGAGRLLLAMEKAGNRRELWLQERDIPAFYGYFRDELQENFLVEQSEVDFEQYRPHEFVPEFYVDCPEHNELTLTVKFRYGQEKISPFDYTMRPGLVRDMTGEKLIAGVIKQYFRNRYANRDCFAIRDSEEEMFRFLSQGTRELAGLGEVYLAERMNRVRVISRPNVSLGIRPKGGWFNLTVDTDGMSHDELQDALKRYRKRERYIRLKSGEFLKLDSEEIAALAELYDSLEKDEEELKVPTYRALYVDELGHRLGTDTGFGVLPYEQLISRLKSVPEEAYQVPESLRGVMKEYQKQGFFWMKNLDVLGFGGILADEMGLGKTLQAISLMLHEAEGGHRTTSVIVCPSSLVYNWKHELEMYAPTLTVGSVAGDAEERAQMLSQWQNYQVLITSYDLLKRDIEQYRSMDFRYCFIDEAQYIKNHLTQNAKAVKQLHAQTRFALTGTPIENRLSELWSIMDFLMPGLLYTYSRFSKEIEQPAVREQSEAAVARLHRMIAPFVLRRMKREVLKDLPDKLETVVYTRLEGEQKRLYAANAAALRDRLTGSDETRYNKERMQVLAELTRLRQICCDPALYYADYEGGSAKLEACIELVTRSIGGGHKILIFSQFTTMLARIGERLRDNDIHYYELTGQTGKKERMELTERFNEDDVPVFLISLKAGGTGLNLTAADVVIHYDPWWNVAAQNQATDRAHRLGQQNVVSVYKLITKSTVEENILLLQENKRKLAEQMIDDGAGATTLLGREELIDLLEERRMEDELY
ncbi:MAG: DEAD/DEAH box helicase [Lachnospiraceae bacterium]|nr:DEAD/DEAH box helicase [Lachnospiraceae bacterium]